MEYRVTIGAAPQQESKLHVVPVHGWSFFTGQDAHIIPGEVALSVRLLSRTVMFTYLEYMTISTFANRRVAGGYTRV